MHIALCDDDKQDLNRLINLVEEYKSNHYPNLTYEVFLNPLELADKIKKAYFDLLILDIVMPNQTGIELATEIRSWNRQIPIIFLTSSPEFAIKSYKVQVQDYLLKPVKESDFFVSIDRQIQKLIQDESRVLFHTVDGMLQIPVASINYIEATNRKVYVIQLNDDVIEITDTIYDLEVRFAKYNYFSRPHRSYLVNLFHIKKIDKDGLHTSNGNCIPIARANMNKLKSQYMQTLLLN